MVTLRLFTVVYHFTGNRQIPTFTAMLQISMTTFICNIKWVNYLTSKKNNCSCKRGDLESYSVCSFALLAFPLFMGVLFRVLSQTRQNTGQSELLYKSHCYLQCRFINQVVLVFTILKSSLLLLYKRHKKVSAAAKKIHIQVSLCSCFI